ncbi:MAG: class I SAM-dependent methyltransferase [Candidatus Staskawiczbacteria bacterium]|nr:class I SAM-dependent methyltransferase [Candidatus Staskawiczbacteria bacterium]
MKNSVIDELIEKYPLISGMVTKDQLFKILTSIKNILDKNVKGDIVELGCNVGTTSLFIRRFLIAYNSDKEFHVYDSFEGLPEKDTKDANNVDRQYSKGHCKTSKDCFMSNFKEAGLELPVIHKGWFSKQKYPEKIAFAFFDGDFYTSIMDSFKKVYPKLSKGAIVCIHDYDWDVLPGVRRACDDFLKGKPEEGLIKSYYQFGILEKK